MVAVVRQSLGGTDSQSALTIVSSLEVASRDAWMTNCRVPVQCVNHHSICLSSLDEDYEFWVMEYRIGHRQDEVPKDWVLPQSDCPKCRSVGSQAAPLFQACFVLLPRATT